MNSKFLHTMLIAYSVLSLSSGCNGKLPLEPIYTNDTNWVPRITLDHNNYHRIEYTLDRPPRKEILRNILYYTIQVSPNSSNGFFTVDSFTYFPPIYIFPSILFPRQSKPVLNYNTQYTLRAAVTYRTGAVRISNEIQFTTPLERGKILKQLPIPKKVPNDNFWFANVLAFYKGKLLVLRDEQLFQVDTSSGQATLLKNNFLPPQDYSNRTFRSMAVCGDTLITFYAGWGLSHTLVRLDLNTLAVDSSLVLPGSEKYITAVVCRDSMVYLLWQLYPTSQEQISVINIRTGQTLQTFSSGVLGIPYPYSLSADGSNLWASMTAWFDNKIVKFDPSSLAILEQHRNPIASPDGLTWDGKNFWAIDRETQTIVKLQLEGL